MTARRLMLAFLALLLSLPAAVFGQAQFSAKLDGNQEVPNVGTAALGTGCFTLSSEGLHFFLTIDGLSSPMTGAHFHLGKRGENGGVLRTITNDFGGTNTAMGLWTATDGEPLDAAAIAALLTGRVYVNIHTQNFAAGEIRGQLDVSGGAHLTANLTGNQENPPVVTDGVGTASATLTSQGLEYKLTVRDLSSPITGAHIHSGAIGVNGGVVLDISGNFTGNSAEGIWLKTAAGGTLTPALVEDLMKGDLYLNIHTQNNAAGEVRGQLFPSAGFGASAAMDGSQEVPPIDVAGTGTGSFTLTSEGLKFHITACELTGPITAAHFHRGEPGVNGPVVRTLTTDFVGGTAVGLWSRSDNEALTEALICELLKGNIYVNIHTAANPGGEVRGQVKLNTGETTLTACLTGNQEESPVNSEATGTATVRLSPTGRVSLRVSHTLGAITGAHIHSARIGTNGGVLFDLTGSFDGCTAEAMWTPASEAEIKSLLTNSLYINIHTAAHPGGEIRGQIMLESGCGYDAQLAGAQEVPPVNSDHGGTCSGTLTPGGGFVISCTHDVDDGTGAHIHAASDGTNGGVVLDMTAPLAAGHVRTTWSPNDPTPLTSSLIDRLMISDLYLNIHTPGAPGGEIRGQILLSAGFYFGASLSGGQEVPPVDSPYRGTGVLTIDECGGAFALTHDIPAGDVTGAHIHNAPPLVNGPVVLDIGGDFVDGTAIGTWRTDDVNGPLTIDLVCENILCNTYFNVHTTQNPTGEIRGQLCERTAASADDPFATDAVPRLLLQNYPNPFSNRTTVAFTLPRDEHVRLRLFDLEGAEILRLFDGDLPAGRHEIPLDSGSLAGGVYFYRLEAGRVLEARKLIVR